LIVEQLNFSRINSRFENPAVMFGQNQSPFSAARCRFKPVGHFTILNMIFIFRAISYCKVIF